VLAAAALATTPPTLTGEFFSGAPNRERHLQPEQYTRLNDVVCVSVGEVRAPTDPGQVEPDLVVDVAELIWEPIAD
jgi:hypothetical protein